jgi:two-component system chemotaxis response regulator CheB
VARRTREQDTPWVRDIIVIGASAGGVELLLDMAARLPRSLPAAVFIVLHTSPLHRSLLAELMDKRGQLPAYLPHHLDPIEHGRVYVAPPDNHLVVREGHVEVIRGAPVSGHRPSVDVLFESAAKAYGERVIGVVLSGYLDCGTVGMRAIKEHGGLSVIQSPLTAEVPDMPRNALVGAPADYVLNAREIPPLLVRLTDDAASGVGSRAQ